MIEYEVGAIPSQGLTLLVRDEMDNPVSLLGYDSWNIEMLDSNDQLADISGVSVTYIPSQVGALQVEWPRDRSLFNEKGKYVLRLVLRTPAGHKDITRAAEIRVREFGRIN